MSKVIARSASRALSPVSNFNQIYINRVVNGKLRCYGATVPQFWAPEMNEWRLTQSHYIFKGLGDYNSKSV